MNTLVVREAARKFCFSTKKILRDIREGRLAGGLVNSTKPGRRRVIAVLNPPDAIAGVLRVRPSKLTIGGRVHLNRRSFQSLLGIGTRTCSHWQRECVWLPPGESLTVEKDHGDRYFLESQALEIRTRREAAKKAGWNGRGDVSRFVNWEGETCGTVQAHQILGQGAREALRWWTSHGCQWLRKGEEFWFEHDGKHCRYKIDQLRRIKAARDTGNPLDAFGAATIGSASVGKKLGLNPPTVRGWAQRGECPWLPDWERFLVERKGRFWQFSRPQLERVARIVAQARELGWKRLLPIEPFRDRAIATLQNGQTGAPRTPVRPANNARDCFAYQLAASGEIWKRVQAQTNEYGKEKGWLPLRSKQATILAVQRYANRNGLSLSMRQQKCLKGRPKKG